MGMLTNLTKTGTGVSTLGDIGGGVMQLGGQAMGMMNDRDQYAYQASSLRNEAIMSRRAARDISRRGGKEMQSASIEYAQIAGAQRAALAANGVVVDQDTAADLGADVARSAALDKSAILANAEKQALMMRYQGQVQDHQAKMAKSARKQAVYTGVANMMGTVMTTGTSVASKWLTMKDDDASASSVEESAQDTRERAHQFLIGY